MSYIKRLIEQRRRTAPAAGGARDFNIDVEIDERLAEQFNKRLAEMFLDNPETRKDVRKMLRGELNELRKDVMKDIRSHMPNDPRQAYRAVKYSVYKQILGGNVSILSRRKAGRTRPYNPPRTLDPTKRGGNRMSRKSVDAARLNQYFGADRSFILRFLNSGTNERNVRFTAKANRKVDKWNKHPNTGTRGRIAPQNIFQNAVDSRLEETQKNIAKVIEDLLQQIYNQDLN